MFQDWQTIAVCLIILGALLYVGRRAWARVRSFGAGGKGRGDASATCASGCGSCGESEQTAATIRTKPQNVLVQITSAGGSAARRTNKR